jgi:hypothetical protein
MRINLRAHNFNHRHAAHICNSAVYLDTYHRSAATSALLKVATSLRNASINKDRCSMRRLIEATLTACDAVDGGAGRLEE